MMLILAAWILGGIASYVAIVVYTKNLNGGSWKDFWAMCSHSFTEIFKIPVYLAIWPLVVAAVLYRIWYAKHICSRIIKHFDEL